MGSLAAAPAVSRVLIVGAGLAGTAAAIGLATGGVVVELIDVKAEVGATGSGITMQGNGLRELRRLGIWEAVLATGYPFDSAGLRAPDAAGTLLADLPDVRTGGPDLPATVGLPRPALARIMTDRAVAAGAALRLGTAAITLSQDGNGVDVTFADGSAGRYNLVIGADGIRSATRQMIGVANEPRPTGMAIFRALGPGRPASPVPTCTTAGPRTSPGTAPPARIRCTRTWWRTRGTAPGRRRRSGWRTWSRSPPPTTGRGTTSGRR